MLADWTSEFLLQEVAMDGVRERLERKFQELLEETAGAAAELGALGRPASGPVHYSQIEAAAHLAGQRLSRQVQQQASRELAAEQPREAACPGCEKQCRLKPAHGL